MESAPELHVVPHQDLLVAVEDLEVLVIPHLLLEADLETYVFVWAYRHAVLTRNNARVNNRYFHSQRSVVSLNDVSDLAAKLRVLERLYVNILARKSVDLFFIKLE